MHIGFAGEGCVGALVDGAFGYEVVDADRLLLALAVEAGISLLVVLEVPCESVPDDGVATVLHIEAVGRGGWVAEEDTYAAGVPEDEVGGVVIDADVVEAAEGFADAVGIVLEGVEDEDGGLGCLDDFLQGGELGVVDWVRDVIIVVDGAVGELGELGGEGGGVGGEDGGGG